MKVLYNGISTNKITTHPLVGSGGGGGNDDIKYKE